MNLVQLLKTKTEFDYRIIIKMASKKGYGADLRKFMDLRVDQRFNGERRIASIMKGYD